MKPHHPISKMFACFAAAALTFVGAVTIAQAAPTALNGQVVLRPLTPTEIATYGLGNAEISSGENTVGCGEAVYLDALVNAAIAPSNIISVTWSLTNKPVGSLAVMTNSPLGTNVPIYKMADRYNQAGAPVSQLAGRALLRLSPNIVGEYTVLATITSSGFNAGTNIAPVTTNIVTTITAANYLGIGACFACHSGSFQGVPNISTWTNTPHSTFFTRAIDGLESSHYSKSCIYCHTVGYDTNANNGGFDDMATTYGWSFPAVLTNGNWASMPSELQGLANIQCENCHGPGSQHMYSHGITGNTNAISISYGAGACTQCHDAMPNHIKAAEWNNSIHAVTTRTPSGPTRPACVRCHTAPGLINYIGNVGSTNGYGTNTVYEAITCQACHDPHDASNPHELRNSPVTLPDGAAVVSITNAGAGAFCMNCHQGRNGSVTNSTVQYPTAKATWQGGNSFGPHDGPQSEMLEGINAVTYGKVIPSSAHRFAVTNTCAGCHMQPVAATDPAYLQAGGHTFSMTYDVVNGGVTNTLDKVDVCDQCHGPSLTSFDYPVQDYNGDGIIEGVQTEVQHLLDRLSTLLPTSSGVLDGLVKTSISTTTNWPANYLNAAYNWQFVNNDGSKGVHNAPFAVGLLKASIADLTGDSNGDGLPDAWQISYFGANFATNPLAAPNAINNTNGIPNWMMYALGLDPHSGSTAVNGVIYVNGKNIVNGQTNTVAIYTAAEIAFNTQVGTTYQIQGISAITGTWQNLSTNIPGTGGSISYVTPTRNNVQMYYRVAHTP